MCAFFLKSVLKYIKYTPTIAFFHYLIATFARFKRKKKKNRIINNTTKQQN